MAKLGDEIIPFRHFKTPTREGIEFDNVSVFNLLLHTYSLIEKAKPSRTSYSIATDGAKVTTTYSTELQG